MGLRILSPAKLNLYLRIKSKRLDGYHEIETVMHEIALADVIEFEPADDLRLEVVEGNAPADGSNLIVQAAELLLRECGIKAGAHVRLWKRIPVGGGLGGGSSNCAAALRALNGLWGLKLTTAELMQFGARLGSDVCFFFSGGAAVCRGRGELVTPIAAPHTIRYLLLVPSFSCSTAEVYRNFTFGLTQKAPRVHDVVSGLEKGDTEQLILAIHNDLSDVALNLYPALWRMKEKAGDILKKQVYLSGSGSTLYSLRADNEETGLEPDLTAMAGVRIIHTEGARAERLNQ